MSKTKKILLLLAGVYILGGVLIVGIFGFSRRDNDEFKPQDEFKLDSWIDLPGPMDFTKAVMYLLIAAVLTLVTMIYIAKRMQDRPNRVQTAVEALFLLMRDNIAGGNMEDKMARRWFPFVGTLFLFIWFSNLIGYIPLPTNTEHPVELFGFQFPAFAIYAATANLAVPLILTIIVWFAYNIQGVLKKGPIGYVKGLMPAGVTGLPLVLVAPIEILSHFVRLVSLSARLFANILAGHLLILLMGGGMIVLLQIEAVALLTVPVGVLFYLFEMGLVAGLQAFIFAILSAIYIGEATAEEH